MDLVHTTVESISMLISLNMSVHKHKQERCLEYSTTK